MRPKLKSDVLYVPTPDGAHVFGAGADMALRGRAAHQWLDRLAPHLDGSTELEALVRGLPEDKRAMVRALVRRLHEAGCLLDAAEDLPHDLTERERETYAAEIAFIEYHGDSAARRFQTYRDSAVVVVGAGPVFVSLVCSALRSGVRRLRAARTAETATDTARLAELVAEASRRDPEQTLTHVALPDGEDAAAEEAALAGADVVLHVASAPAVDRALRLDRLCRRTGALLVQGLVLDDVAWLGPAGPAWRSAWRRLDARPPFRTGEFCTGPAAAVVAGHLGLAAFKAVTGIAAPDDAELTRIDLETLRTSAHAFLPHPADLPAGPEAETEFTARIERLRTAEPLGEEDFSAAAARCFDPYAGVLGRLDERDFLQVPLHVTEAVTRTGGAGRVFGAGLDFAEARRRAALRGLAVYAATTVDPRRRGAGDTVWGWDVLGERACAVPAAEAFGPGTGLAAEPGWEAAVTDGIAQHCAASALSDVTGGRTRPVGLAVEDAAPDERVRRLLGLLRAARGTVRVADIGGALGVPVLAWWQDGEPVAVTCGPGAAAAGLERALLHRQAALDGGADYAPSLIPGLGRPPRPAAGAVRGPGPDRRTMARALLSRGRRPVAVPLDHDPSVHEVLPSVLRVVTVDG
ncbi:hypothetical protein ACFSJS_15835 [Streptomyces desertarenae]|uniref:Thiazole-containing bacteriocin maturation protein n=1 Tax=Streptomyces desertarenae TaxID=2666184 RepID=A0ABW4PLM4_9ACTN